MAQQQLKRIQKQLGSISPKFLVLAASVVFLLGLLVIFVLFGNEIAYKTGLKTRPVGPDALDYWDETQAGVSFVWQPKGASYSTELLGEKRTGNFVANSAISPGFQLVNDGYTQVPLEKSEQSATQATTGFQKGQEICVLTTSISDGHEGLLENTPDLNYELICGTLTQN